MPEREFEIVEECIVMLWEKGIPCWVERSGHALRSKRASDVKGVPDIIGLLKPSGRMLAVEVKTPRGRVSDEQKNFQAVLVEHGGLAFTVTSAAQLEQRLALECGIAVEMEPEAECA